MFGFSVTLYLFIAGMGAGLYIASCLVEREMERARPPRDMQLLHQKALIISLLLVCAGSAFLILDLTVPQKMYLVFKRPFGSVISFGAWLIALLTLMLAVRNGFWRIFATSRSPLIRFLKAATFLLACGVTLYTGFFLIGLKAISFWESLLVVALFAISSLSSGIACFSVLAAFSLRRSTTPPVVCKADQVDTFLLAAEIIVLGIFVVSQLFGDAASAASSNRLISGELAWAFWLMLVGIGLLFPFGLSVFGRANHKLSPLVVKGISVCIGCFFLRYCIMEAGVRSFSLA